MTPCTDAADSGLAGPCVRLAVPRRRASGARGQAPPGMCSVPALGARRQLAVAAAFGSRRQGGAPTPAQSRKPSTSSKSSSSSSRRKRFQPPAGSGQRVWRAGVEMLGGCGDEAHGDPQRPLLGPLACMRDAARLFSPAPAKATVA